MPKSVFSQSFALRRISPLEFKNLKRTPEGVPVYHDQPLPQKRGGSLGYGGVYPVDFGGEDEGVVVSGRDDEDYGEERDHGSHGGGHGGQGGFGQYDDFHDYNEGRQGGQGHQGGASYEK